MEEASSAKQWMGPSRSLSNCGRIHAHREPSTPANSHSVGRGRLSLELPTLSLLWRTPTPGMSDAAIRLQPCSLGSNDSCRLPRTHQRVWAVSHPVSSSLQVPIMRFQPRPSGSNHSCRHPKSHQRVSAAPHPDWGSPSKALNGFQQRECSRAQRAPTTPAGVQNPISECRLHRILTGAPPVKR